ncbi:uncharacterized protein KNAG_0I01040 [Huiozyma naganishii CBS 8797]|uniref:3beta-hydroxysteroid 3-dehydrogenase n=1 Tax=Huiozyma naganishii (strain ATCC MYA-139 / BCRC 22969 / CBS 8797 / KCTC 17520 / NBRC 10181 / NCYC 3082 / Yp74L-3) TaxID=1071383 RepID=J7RAJ3_HUIN7|nr:hypothetical protein KNAG_0I01040 [Kazachstania naganishii CBS 8797]CCK71895.1 hypothetical protein KNAG_0I01040 [Kazachstania naganishii CBS 8797]
MSEKVAVILGANRLFRDLKYRDTYIVSFSLLVNSYLGLKIAYRLLENQDPSTNVKLVVTSRTEKRCNEAIEIIKRDVGKIERSGKLSFDSLLLDLTDMESVLKAANTLNDRYEEINYFFVNAALGACDGINWFAAIWEVMTDPMKSVTDPSYRIQNVGVISKDQMGYIFQANVFGSYYLIQKILNPLSKGKAVVVWISSLCSTPQYLSLDDIELINSTRPYDGSKRLIDLLHLATYKKLKEMGIYQYVVQPGIFISLSFSQQMSWISYYSMLFLFRLARRFGSYWHTIDGYKAANSAAYVTTFRDRDFERQDLKYGSATYNDGVEYVKSQEIDPLGRDKVYRYIEGKREEWDIKLQNT